MSRYPRGTVELSLASIRGDGPLAGGARAVERLVTATLLWPRPLIAERNAARTFTFSPEGLDLHERDWTDRILFKETVEGPFGLVLQVTEGLTAAQVGKLAAAFGAAMLRTAGTELGRLAADPWSAALIRFPLQHLAGELGWVGKAPAVVAAGAVTLRPGHATPIDLPLSVPADITRVRRSGPPGRVRTRREIRHRANAPAGTARVDASYYRA